MKTAEKIIKLAQSCVGIKEGSGSHKEILNTYNNHKPLARSYKMKTTDAWCCCFVSYLSIKCGYTSIIPTEVGCEPYINLFKKLGVWIENENRTPNPGDIIFYDWEDNGKGDNTGRANHVGIVESVSKDTISVIEGNMNNKVGRRSIKVNGKYIRGYATPKYDKAEPKKESVKVEEPKESTKTHIVKSGETLSSIAKKYKTTITKLYNENKTIIDKENKKRGVAISKKWLYPGQKLVIK